MQQLKILNVKKAEYKSVNLNKIFDPDKEHKPPLNSKIAP